ncbi:MAG TPA: HAD family hydrolase [Candidatus Rubrimentiphilum sp.]|nr:HAD family hydrolase [Candidatus Rubrimentiphilum sp.]
MRELRAVLFDLDDTLHDDTLAFTSAADEVAHEIAAEHGVDALALKDAYIAEAEGFWKKLTAEQVHELLVSKLSSLRSRLWGSALRSVGLDDPVLAERSATNYNRYRAKYFALFPGALDLLKQLRAAGIKLGLVTNGVSETHREKIALLEVSDYFDAIFLADEVGMVKPDPRLFAHACEKLGVEPAAAAMVGDRYERDIAGAIEAGLYTVWMNLRGEPVPEGASPPDAMVGTIGEVGAVLCPPEEPGAR